MKAKARQKLRDAVYDELREMGFTQGRADALSVAAAGAVVDAVAAGVDIQAGPADFGPEEHEDHELISSFDLKRELEVRVRASLADGDKRMKALSDVRQVDPQAIVECQRAGRDFIAGMEALDRLPRGMWDAVVTPNRSGVTIDIVSRYQIKVAGGGEP